ncbi:hypothetical protein HF086_002153 [Spodoptera exigua]|uniref:Gag-pol polyprotein n=1 Tax=Spodoptera exigua TaxID=7107 RepID=A0A922SGV0_SPOEX|nr:hypothetical protein HF086_002153 [Spodoptera exigua]
MSEERDLIKKRGSFKGRLTAFVNFLDSLKDKTFTRCDVSELQLRMGKIESLYEQYDEVQLRLECIADDIKLQVSERSDFESLYYKSLSRAQNILTDFNKDNEPMGSCKSTPGSMHKPVKLPTIQLPKFSGLYSNWLEFRDTFTSLIHTNDDIDDINKFHYLRASLEGTAAIVIKSVEFSSSNYSVAWKLLRDRFDNRRLLVQNHVSALFNIESLSKESSVALKSLIDQLNKDLRALESLGEPVKQWDTLLIYIVTRKLDQRTYREWEECKGSLDKTSPIAFEVFMQFLRSRADLIETLELSRTNYSQAVIKTGPKIKSMVATQSPTSSISELTSKGPKISEIIIHDFYVDDLLTGGRDLDEVRFIRAEVTKALASACMPLRKWRSNDPQLVSDAVPQSFHLNIGSDEPDKLLGLGWHVNSDDLGFPIGFTKSTNGYTKRDLLSVIARIFDPMGLLCPIVVTMKVLLQKMCMRRYQRLDPT